MAPVVYYLLLTFPETSTALNDRRKHLHGIAFCSLLINIVERHIAINRLAIGNTRKTDVTWDYAAVKAVLLRPSTYLFFISYTCLCLIGTSQGTFAPTILHQVRSTIGKVEFNRSPG